MSDKLSKNDKDFAHAMALKLRLNREKLAEKEKQQKAYCRGWRISNGNSQSCHERPPRSSNPKSIRDDGFLRGIKLTNYRQFNFQLVSLAQR